MRKPQTFGRVNSFVASAARKHGIRIYRYANVGNHLHILVRIPRLGAWPAFIREITGQIAQFMHSQKGFWIYRPHTRIVQGWKRAFNIAKDYIYLNNLEGEGWINRRETKSLKDLRAIFSD